MIYDIHGGDWRGYLNEYGKTALDFSANVNPLGAPEGVRRAIREWADSAHLYPDPLCRELKSALAEFHSVRTEQIECGSGAADLIWRLGAALTVKRAAVTAPTFTEYAAAMTSVGAEVARLQLSASDGFNVTERILENLHGTDCEVLFLCNPNNPTSLTVEPELMLKIAERCRERGIVLVADECFNPFLDEPERHSLLGHIAEYPNLLILRAFTKLYGMAGVRLGYCISSDEGLIAKIAAAGQPWAVSGAAQAAGVAALREDGYVAESLALIRAEKPFLIQEFAQIGCEVLGCEANYIFFRTDELQLAEKLRERGIMIRDCSGFEGLSNGYYRIAVRTHEENSALIRAIRELNSSES